MYRILPALLLVACSSSATDQVVDDYQALLAEARTLAVDHGALVQAAASVDDVDVLESTYQTDWDAMSVRMAAHMAVIEGCDMDEHDMEAMDDVTAMMADMDGLVADHVAAHGTHTELAQCTAGEASHLTDLDDRITSMTAHGEDWRMHMRCSDDGGMDM